MAELRDQKGYKFEGTVFLDIAKIREQSDFFLILTSQTKLS